MDAACRRFETFYFISKVLVDRRHAHYSLCDWNSMMLLVICWVCEASPLQHVCVDTSPVSVCVSVMDSWLGLRSGETPTNLESYFGRDSPFYIRPINFIKKRLINLELTYLRWLCLLEQSRLTPYLLRSEYKDAGVVLLKSWVARYNLQSPPCISHFCWHNIIMDAIQDPERKSRVHKLEERVLNPRDVLNTDCLLVSYH